MRSLYIFSLAISFISCKPNAPKVTLFKTQGLVIVDSTHETFNKLEYGKYDSDYPIYYMGVRTDTIKIGKRFQRERTNYTGNFKSRWSNRYNSGTLIIFVDTSVNTNLPVEYSTDSPEIVNDSTIDYSSFLFSINNISDSIIYLGSTFSVFFIHCEAKNRNGEWVKIDKKLSEYCICEAGEPDITLNPKEMVLSKVRRYRGSFATGFRLAFGYDKNIVYSSVFRDSIDERIFEKSLSTQ